MYDHVIWPERYDPKTSAISAVNDIDVKAPPEVVWKLLLDAEHWAEVLPRRRSGENPDPWADRHRGLPSWSEGKKARLAEFLRSSSSLSSLRSRRAVRLW
jgi:hypothetical protein